MFKSILIKSLYAYGDKFLNIQIEIVFIYLQKYFMIIFNAKNSQ